MLHCGYSERQIWQLIFILLFYLFLCFICDALRSDNLIHLLSTAIKIFNLYNTVAFLEVWSLQKSAPSIFFHFLYIKVYFVRGLQLPCRGSQYLVSLFINKQAKTQRDRIQIHQNKYITNPENNPSLLIF